MYPQNIAKMLQNVANSHIITSKQTGNKKLEGHLARRQTETDRDTEPRQSQDRGREIDRQRDRQRERERDRDRQRERDVQTSKV